MQFDLLGGRSPGGQHGNPLQYSRLENPMDRGACQATVHGVTKELDATEQLSNINNNVYAYHFSPGVSILGVTNLVCCDSWGRQESDTTA